MAKCVVIGGNGFLGSWVVDELVAAGHDVTVFDRFSGPPAFTAEGVRMLEGDFFDTDSLAEAVAGQDYLFHFLSSSTPASADTDPSGDLRTNVARSVELFELAADAGVSTVYFASTGGAMYGDSPLHTISELAVPAPVSPYAIGKLAIEGYLRYFERKRGLASVSFRISNPYGPRQHPHRKQGVIPIFLQRVAEGLPLEVYGDGSAVRDYVYVADAARMMASIVGRPTRHAVYNIGSGVGESLREVIELTREVTGVEPGILNLPQPATFVDRVVLDTDRFAQEFGRPALVSLGDGMRMTWTDTLARRDSSPL